jgi:UDP-N-acetylmuramoyl-tripeptide--D-alanyl-D-alanine ligase
VRRASGARVVAITGSAGKTTTKEAAATLIGRRFRTLRNRGNLNNHVGLPLSLLELQQGFDVAVVELGMNHKGEISRLVEIAEPEVRVWTNVGTAHLEFFGSMDAIAEAKAEILEGANRETRFVANADDPRVMGRAKGFHGRVITFGVDAEADVKATSVSDRGADGQTAAVRTHHGHLDLEIPLPGRGHLLNVLAAIAIAGEFGIPADAIEASVRALRPAAHRGEVIPLARNVRILDDCYNSSPSALQRTLEIVAASAVEGRRVAVLGEMLELGAQSSDLHRECGRAAVRAGVSRLVTVGGAPAQALGESAREAGLRAGDVQHFAKSAEAAEVIASLVQPGDLVLVKGSRGVRLELVVERLKQELA